MLATKEQIDAIQSREDLARFVRDLAVSLKRDPEQWQNLDLKLFLQAAAAWIDDMDGYYLNLSGEPAPEKPTWQVFAQILAAASVYE